jgi:penicillin V acylase-like amidase (Ntn superfamily)
MLAAIPLRLAALRLVMLLSGSVFAIPSAEACTRALYVGDDGTVITGRSMDWSEDMQSNMWAMPRGMKRNGAAGPGSITWTSRYGSVGISGYEAGIADGMNETGLVANMLYLVESEYGEPAQGKSPMSISLWAQYVLDNFATVAEAVDVLRQEPFAILAPSLPNGSPAQLHLAISDPTGDSAIFEYIGGKLIIHHGKQYRVMTNSPRYDTFLPGTNQAPDRFARASFLINAIPKAIAPAYIKAVPGNTFGNQAVAGVLSVIRSVSVPLGIITPNKPNISATIWRSVADQTNKVYFFDSATSPNTFWVKLSDLDLAEGAPVKKLTMAGGRVYSGNTAANFEPTPMLHFLPAKAE